MALTSAYLFMVLALLILSSFVACQYREMPLRMPLVRPTQNETYLCTGFRLPYDHHEHIVAFEPHASMQTAHHMLLYGCRLPGYMERDTPRVIWDCGEMSKNDDQRDPSLLQANVCEGSMEIIYAWAMDAPALTLPKGVGFKIGGDTGINFLVLQVHYANVDPFLKQGQRDLSGVTLKLADPEVDKVDKLAGVLLLGTVGEIPAAKSEKVSTIEHMESFCHIRESVELHPFAFRVHTHKLGTAVSGWKINNGNWDLIGKRDPQKPQMFYPVSNVKTIRQGDTIVSRCTMKNYLPHKVKIGPTGNDEMCNFYLMFYVDGNKLPTNRNCFSSGPPKYYWSRDPMVGPPPEDVDKMASEV